jgi:hypothetical protein
MVELSLSNIIMGIVLFFFGVLVISTGSWVRLHFSGDNIEWKKVFCFVFISGVILCIIFIILTIIGC